MEKFKFKFTAIIYVLIVLGFAFTAVCLVMNIVRIGKVIASDTIDAYTIISIALAILMCAAFSVLIIALLVDSSYVFEQKFLVIKFGLIKSNVDYTTIKQIVWFKETNKLTVYYTDESFNNIIIADDEYELFANTLISHNPSISFHIDINTSK